jgi:hypothetical protein
MDKGAVIVVLCRERTKVFGSFIRGEGLTPCGSTAVIKGLNLSPTAQENSISCGSAPGLLIRKLKEYV